jgi:hypothetical protein
MAAGSSNNEYTIHIGAAVCSHIAPIKLFEGIQIQFYIYWGGGGRGTKINKLIN